MINLALSGDVPAVRSLLDAGWTLWISPAILQGKRGVVELRFQSAEGRERHSLPVLTFVTLRDLGAVTTQPGSPDDLWVRCTLNERALNPGERDEEDTAPKAVASSAA